MTRTLGFSYAGNDHPTSKTCTADSSHCRYSAISHFCGMARVARGHNPQVTLMRTTPEENRKMGQWIGAKLNAMDGPVRFLLPEGGVSGLDAPGQPFDNEQARTALIEALEETVETTSDRQLIKHPAHINDPAFAALVVSAFKDLFTHTRSTLNAKN